MENKYPIRIEWSEQDGEFLATCPAFPRLMAFGKTEEAALKEAQVVRQLFIETAIHEGIELPAESEAHEYSGQVRLRMPKSLHQQAAMFAETEGVSLNTFFVDAIAMRVGAEKFADRLVKEHSKVEHRHSHVHEHYFFPYQRRRAGSESSSTASQYQSVLLHQEAGTEAESERLIG